MRREELTDPPLVFRRREVVDVLVPRPVHLPDLLRALRFGEERTRLVELGVLVLCAGDEKERLLDPRNRVDWAKAMRVDTDPRRDQLNERRRDRTAKEAERAKPDMQSVGHGVVEGGIDGFEDEGVDREGLTANQHGRASHRHANHPNTFSRCRAAEESERCFGVQTLELTEGDVSAGTLAMRLEIGREDRESSLV